MRTRASIWAWVVVVAMTAAACSRRDEPKVTAPNDPVKPITPPASTAVSEEPMVLALPASGTIPAPSTVARPPPDAVVTPSGLATKKLTSSSGIRPGPRSRVVVHYSGWTTDGKLFDSSIVRGTPATFPLDGVIPGFREGVQLMVEGETRRLWIPENLAYGGSAAKGAPKGMLVFDIQLITVLP